MKSFQEKQKAEVKDSSKLSSRSSQQLARLVQNALDYCREEINTRRTSQKIGGKKKEIFFCLLFFTLQMKASINHILQNKMSNQRCKLASLLLLNARCSEAIIAHVSVICLAKAVKCSLNSNQLPGEKKGYLRRFLIKNNMLPSRDWRVQKQKRSDCGLRGGSVLEVLPRCSASSFASLGC